MNTHNIRFHGELRKNQYFGDELLKAILSNSSLLLTTNLKLPK